MKSKNLLSVQGLRIMVFFLLISISLQSQITIQGLLSENEGAAGWDADGTGPEPFGDGHETFLYYSASLDYVDPASEAGSHVLSIGADFNAFAQALIANGFTPDQLQIKMDLASMGNDEEGIDWFNFGVMEFYMNFYPLNFSMLLDGEMMITGTANYLMFHYGFSTDWFIHVKSNFFTPADASGNSSSAVQNVAAAFLQDVGSDELQIITETFGQSVTFSGNGRNGSKYNYSGTIEKGHAELPFQGLAADHEGFAGWDAGGTGPEPKGDGHDDQLYYIASRDYDDIDPDPNACFAHFLDNGMEGFQNFALQLAYKGFTPEQIKIKMDLRDLGEDIAGEDWSYDGNIHAVNFYHSNITAELNGEPLFGFVCDTAKSYQNVNNPGLGWWGTSAKTIIYDASGNSSADIQAVAMSFFKDLEQRQIQTVTSQMTSVPGIINTNGRSGGYWQVNAAKLVAVRGPGTIIEAGNVSGIWDSTGHPYIVTGDITIPDNQSLVIEPGVWVKFSDRVHFKVDGAIQAIGDTSNLGSIVFTAVNPELGWGHLVFDSVDVANAFSEFEYCIFEYGSAAEAIPFNSPYNCGGAIGIRNTDKIRIENCLFHHNKALNNGYYTAGGGAIALWGSSPVIRNCIFDYNTANWSGAIGIAFGSSPEIANCLFYGNLSLKNTTDGGGAVLIAQNSNPVLLNNTFVNNHSNFRGGALEIFSLSHPDLINNIFWGNTAPQNSQIYISSYGCNVDIKYNDIEGGQAGIGPFGIGTGVYENNKDADPVFTDVLALDYQLDYGSPCIDAGIPDVSGLNLPPEDLLGNWRIWNGGVNGEIVDMGPFEYGAPLFTGIENNLAGSSNLIVNCYPNPVAEKGTINYQLTQTSFVIIEMYNYLGQKVQELFNDTQPNGTYEIQFNAGNLKTGVYILKLTTKSHDHFFKFTKID